MTEVKDRKGKGSGTKDACYHKVKSRYSVWPSAYASGALVKCRKVGAANWGNSSKKEEVEVSGVNIIERSMVPEKVRQEYRSRVTQKKPGKLIKQGVRKVGQAGGSAKPKKIGDTFVVKGGRRVKVTTKTSPSADYNRKSFMQSQKDKLEAQKKGMSVKGLEQQKDAYAKAVEAQKKAGEKAYQDFLNKPANVDPTKGKITGKSRSITNIDDTKGITPSKTGKVDPTISRGRRKRVRTNPEIDERYDWRSTLDEKCWAGYEKKGMKTMFGKRYPNCVKKSKKKK